MQLLFKREQTLSNFGRPIFKLWSKLELDEEEKRLLHRYKMSETILISVDQPTLFRSSVIIAVLAFIITYPIIAFNFWRDIGLGMTGVVLVSLGIAIVCGYIFFHQMRETIYVRDLMYGRHFKCRSVVALAQKEHWIGGVSAYMRQVLESAKNWDGTEKVEIPPLPKDEAFKVIRKG